jgi:spoIIIJ-associated protein
MNREIEITAKSYEEAVEEAVAKLEAPSADALTITVLQEAKKGFLGLGGTPAIIKAVYETQDTAPKAPKTAKAPKAPVETETAEEEAARIIPLEEAGVGAVAAYHFVENLAKNMGMDITITMKEGTNDDVVLCVDGDEAGALIGHHGETMEALQYLANLAANHREEGEKRTYTRITVDVEHYRAKREAALRALARRKAEQVLKYKKSMVLEPMNPYERRVIHSEIQNIEGVATNSIGVDNNRRIVIFLEETGMPQQPTAKKPSRKRSGRSGGSKVSADPFHPTPRKQPVDMPSTFSEDDVKDPFDIDISVAMSDEE